MEKRGLAQRGNNPTAGRRRQIFRRKLLGPPYGALRGFGGLRLVEEVGRVLAAGLAAIDAETIVFWVVLDGAGFCASAAMGLAEGL